MYVAQYQAFKDKSNIIQVLLKVNVDRLMVMQYREYNGYMSVVKSKRAIKRKLYTCNHYENIDNLWSETEVIGLYCRLTLKDKHSKDRGELESKLRSYFYIFSHHGS